MTDETRQLRRDDAQGEVDRAAIYRALADGESDEKLAAVYRKLAAVEAAHAEMLGPDATPSLRARLLALIGRRLGPALVLPALSAAQRGEGPAGQVQGEPGATQVAAPAPARWVSGARRPGPAGRPGGVRRASSGGHRLARLWSLPRLPSPSRSR